MMQKKEIQEIPPTGVYRPMQKAARQLILEEEIVEDKRNPSQLSVQHDRQGATDEKKNPNSPSVPTKKKKHFNDVKMHQN